MSIVTPPCVNWWGSPRISRVFSIVNFAESFVQVQPHSSSSWKLQLNYNFKALNFNYSEEKLVIYRKNFYRIRKLIFKNQTTQLEKGFTLLKYILVHENWASKMKFFRVKEFSCIFMNFDFTNVCKNEFKGNNEKSCRWSRNKVSHKIDFKAQGPRNGNADSVGINIFYLPVKDPLRLVKVCVQLLLPLPPENWTSKPSVKLEFDCRKMQLLALMSICPGRQVTSS